MIRYKDLTGQRFGKLVVLKYAYTQKGNSFWLCKCDCGNEKIIKGANLKKGNTKSCGCLKKQSCFNSIKHSYSKTRLYSIWCEMKARCLNEKHFNYKNYGARGITVCDEWQNDFLVFQKWALDNGYDKNAKYGECTIDRIDVNGNYCPQNCRFVDMAFQSNNKRNNVYLSFEGKNLTLSQWCNILKLKRDFVKRRLKMGLSFEEIVNQNR